MKVKVIDSPCGSGKTSYAIQYMNTNCDNKRFIFITPFLKQILRVKRSTRFNIMQPTTGHKYQDLLKLIQNGNHIITTHSLFQLGDQQLIKLLQAQNYQLILDEVLQVVTSPGLYKGWKMLLNKTKAIATDENNTVYITDKGREIWQDGVDPLTNQTFNIIQTGRVILVNDIILLWLFPIDILKHFKSITIMTYMFDNQTMHNYLKSNGAQFQYFHTVQNFNSNSINRKFDLVDGRCSYKGSKYKHLINIYDGKLNITNKKQTMFSSTWYKQQRNKPLINAIKNNAYNYLHHIINAKQSDTIWTCPKKLYDNQTIKLNRYSNAFIPMNTRATNDYSNKTTLVYLANRYENPVYVNYFNSKGLFTDNDLFAISQFIQWIFRSAVRNNKPINIYIPSQRMRNLLISWLNDQIL